MDSNPASDPRTEARAFMRRAVLGIVALACAAAVVLVLSNGLTPWPLRGWLAAAYTATGALALLARRWTPRRSEWTLVGICLFGLALIGVNAVANGWGINAPGAGFFVIFAFFVAAVVSARAAVGVAAACAAVLLGLAWLEHLGLIRGVGTLMEVSVQRRLLNQLIMLGISLAIGLLVTRVFNHYLQSAREREQRWVEAAEALRRSEDMLSHLVGTSPDLITLSDAATGRFVRVNEAFTRVTGYSAAEAVGKTSMELGIWPDAAARAAFLQRLLREGSVQDEPMAFQAKAGRTVTLIVGAASFELEGGRYLVFTGRDITAAEHTRMAHEAVLDNASLGIALTRAQRFEQANPAFEKMLGHVRGSLVGQPGRVVWSSDAEYAAIGARVGPALSRGEPVEFTEELTRPDGSRVWCRLLAKAVDPTHPLRGGTIWIVEDITERRRTEQALDKARDEADAANRAKSAFLANTSHEIRTPLNGLVGLARLARRPDVDEARRRQYLDQIADSAETLSTLISDVLDLSKIEAGRLEIERVGFDLHALLDSLRQVYGALAEARGLSFALHIEAGVPAWAWGDPVRLRQVLANLLTNALKFTSRGAVTLQALAATPRAGAGADTLRFEVRDTGIGIAPEVQARLFQPFTQADQSTTRRYGGSGLGLSICRQLAELMAGRVGVDSAPGQGSCFWLELPMPEAEPREGGSGFGELDSPALAGTRVLVAEDNVVNMTIAVAMLEQWGIEVAQATDGAQAIAAVERAAAAGRPFDVLLMDVQMPVMGGYEATRHLRALPAAQGLPIIAVTAAALDSEREQALACGMTGFLTKPIDARRLRDTLVQVLETRRAGGGG